MFAMQRIKNKGVGSAYYSKLRVLIGQGLLTILRWLDVHFHDMFCKYPICFIYMHIIYFRK